jgi:hypothetical protein
VNAYLWLLVAIPVSYVVLQVGFVYCYSIQSLLERGVWMPKDMRWIGKGLYYFAALSDVIWNQTRGRWIFREWSTRGLMFSTHVQYWVDHGIGPRRETAIKWATLLNSVAPGHIKNLSPNTSDTHL